MLMMSKQTALQLCIDEPVIFIGLFDTVLYSFIAEFYVSYCPPSYISTPWKTTDPDRRFDPPSRYP